MCRDMNPCDYQPGARFFHRNSNSMQIPFHSHLDSNNVIATKFCTWHDSCAVVACAKICCDLMARRSFHRIWIAGKKSLVKRAPCLNKIPCKHTNRLPILGGRPRFNNIIACGINSIQLDEASWLIFQWIQLRVFLDLQNAYKWDVVDMMSFISFRI